MGCGGSKEDDRSRAGGTSATQTYAEQADEAAAALDNGGTLVSRLQLSISCTGLKNLDKFSKSDPFVVVSMQTGAPGAAWVEVGRTEIISNTLDPQFVTLVAVMYRFEEVQTLRCDVYDVDTGFTTSDATGLVLSKQDFQGKAECAIATIVGSPGQAWTAPLVNPRLAGQHARITVRAEEGKDSNALVTLRLRGTGIRRGGNGTFLRMSRIGEASPPVPCYKTEAAKGGAGGAISWKQVSVPLRVLANGDAYRPLLIECFHWKRSGSHAPVGECRASVNDMQGKVSSGTPLQLQLPAPQGRGKAAGGLAIEACALTPQPSFFDYLAGGMEMNFSVAIDYTLSNGAPNVPGTLHFHDPRGMVVNEYEQAIVAVGNVIQFYDTDKLFPVYGFGGAPVQHGPASHCFPVNGSEAAPEVEGVPGVVEAYRRSLFHVQLSGPTLFAPVINQVASVAASTANPPGRQYTVLLIITDGIITDMANTVEAVVAAADLPMSIIIVGVGKANFKAMEALDGDDVRLTNQAGKVASRDIVQFVPMRDFLSKGPQALAKEVLAEVPGQVLEYMKQRNIPAKPPRPPAVPGGPGQASFNKYQGSFMAGGAAPAPGGSRLHTGGAAYGQGQAAYSGLNAPTAPGGNPPPYAPS